MNTSDPQTNAEKNHVAKRGALQQTVSSQSQVWSEDPRYQKIALRIGLLNFCTLWSYSYLDF